MLNLGDSYQQRKRLWKSFAKAGAFLIWIFKAENPWTIGFNQCTTNQNWGESIARRSSTVNRKPSRFRTLENDAAIRKPTTTQRGWSVLVENPFMLPPARIPG
jgi:hypothetical protein